MKGSPIILGALYKWSGFHDMMMVPICFVDTERITCFFFDDKARITYHERTITNHCTLIRQPSKLLNLYLDIKEPKE